LLSLTIVSATAQQPQQKPNVVFILADNVGYADMGPYGGGNLRGMPTPRTDQLAVEGLRLTQFLVEPSCTPSRAALMTGQYSIRNGLSLATVPGTPNTLSGNAYTMGQLFKEAGYATAIFGKWHLGIEPQSLPGAHGFDEFYGIPPDTSWDDAVTVPLIMQTHSIDAPEQYLIEKGPWIMAQKAGGPLEKMKPFTPEVRAEIDNDLTDRSVAFIKQQAAASKPFFHCDCASGSPPQYYTLIQLCGRRVTPHLFHGRGDGSIVHCSARGTGGTRPPAVLVPAMTTTEAVVPARSLNLSEAWMRTMTGMRCASRIHSKVGLTAGSSWKPVLPFCWAMPQPMLSISPSKGVSG
jgi:hypothetical protein